MANPFKVGERVRFLREKREGVVQEILSRNQLLILVDDFLDLEVSADDVVKIHDAEVRIAGMENTSPAFPEIHNLPPDMSLAICRNTESNYDLILVNPGADRLLFSAFGRIKAAMKPIGAGTLKPNRFKQFGELSSDEFHALKNIFFQIIYFPLDGTGKPRPVFEFQLDVRLLLPEANSAKIPGVDRDGYLFPLKPKAETTEPARIEITALPTEEKISGPPPEVVDLHIDKLVSTTRGLENDAIFQIQLNEFSKCLDGAIFHGMSKIVFIHGIGTFALRSEIHRILKKDPRVKSVEAGDPIVYGSGATVAILD